MIKANENVYAHGQRLMQKINTGGVTTRYFHGCASRFNLHSATAAFYITLVRCQIYTRQIIISCQFNWILVPLLLICGCHAKIRITGTCNLYSPANSCRQISHAPKGGILVCSYVKWGGELKMELYLGQILNFNIAIFWDREYKRMSMVRLQV